MRGRIAVTSSRVIVALLAAMQSAPDAPRTASSELHEPSFVESEPEAAPPPKSDSTDVVAIEQCDGSRTRPPARPKALTCARWKIEWIKDGKIWGVSSADSFVNVIAERERQLGFARQYARLFDAPFDARWREPSQPICDACEQNVPSSPSGLWGDAQAFGANPTMAALAEARTKLVAFEATLADVHVPRLRDIARLSRSPATAKLAKAYAKTLEASVLDLAKLQLDLENAALFRSLDGVKKTVKEIDARTKALDHGASALLAAVAKAIARIHGGRYSDPTATVKSELLVEVAADKVTATFIQGEAKSVWFEGNVFLDGRVAGRSLVAPETGALACSAHSLECGYVYVPAILRFDATKDDKGKHQTVELWFQQSTWVHAKPFSR